MGVDRHSIIEAGTHMRMAVLTMEEVMRTAGRRLLVVGCEASQCYGWRNT